MANTINTGALLNNNKTGSDESDLRKALEAAGEGVVDALYIYSGCSDSTADISEKIDGIIHYRVVNLQTTVAAQLISYAVGLPPSGKNAEKEVSNIISIMLKAGLSDTREMEELTYYLSDLKNSNLLHKFGLGKLDLDQLGKSAANIYLMYESGSKFVAAAKEITDHYENGRMPSGHDLLEVTLNGGGTVTTLISEIGSHLGPIASFISDVIAYVGNTLLYTISELGEMVIKLTNKNSTADLQSDLLTDDYDSDIDYSKYEDINTEELYFKLQEYNKDPMKSGLTLHEVEYCYEIWGKRSENIVKFENLFEKYISYAYAQEIISKPGYKILNDLSKYCDKLPKESIWSKWYNFWYDMGEDVYDATHPDEFASHSPTDGDDYIMGTDKADEIDAKAGNDHVHGFEGDDILKGGEGNDRLFGYAGNDHIWGGEGDDRLRGGDGDDFLYGQEGNDVIRGDAGNDKINGGKDNDFLEGGEGNDEISGGAHDDVIYGGTGDDFLYGDLKNEASTDGDDFIYGGAGNDHIFGGGGNDTIMGDGYDSKDVITSSVNLCSDTIEGGSGDDTIDGGYGNDRIDGGTGNDTIYGGIGNDTIHGGADDDYIEGGAGDDSLYGDDGHDTLVGGYGDDYLAGGAGNDTYIFNQFFGVDHLTDTEGQNTIVFENRTMDDFKFDLYGYKNNGIKLLTDSGDVLTIPNYIGNESKFKFVFGSADEETSYKLEYSEEDGFSFTENKKPSGGPSSGITPPTPTNPSGGHWGKIKDDTTGSNIDEYGEATVVTPPRDPLVIDFNYDGVHITDVENGVYFDLDNNGFAEKTQWIDNIDGFLVFNRDSDPNITNGSELFSDQVILSNGKRSENGFEVLKEFDTNKDNVINKEDKDFDKLQVWIDTDHNGSSINEKNKELFTLKELNIKSISTIYRTEGSDIIADVEFENGKTTSISEYWFDGVLSDTQELNATAIDNDLTSFGNLHSIGYALEHDETKTLSTLLSRFNTSDSYIEKRVLIREILYYLTDSANIDPNSRGGRVDARNLHVIETIMGVDSFIGADGSNIPNSNAAPILNKVYDNFEKVYFNLLNKDSNFAEYVSMIYNDFNEETGENVLNISAVLEKIDDHISYGWNVDEAIFSMSTFLNSYDTVFNTSYLNEFKEHYADKASEITAYLNASLVIGTNSNDSLYATNSNEIIWSGDGNDTVNAAGGDDIVFGGAGNDTINAGAGNDYIYGESGDDTLNGGAGDDTYYFGENHGNDVVNDKEGNNKLVFAEGLSIDDYDMSIDARLGFVLTHKETGETISLPDFLRNPLNYDFISNGTNVSDNIGGGEREIFNGTDGDDVIKGGDSFNIMYGGAGNDTLNGGKDMDFMYGGDGDDLLNGRNGVNVLFGEGGNDVIYDGDQGSYINGGDGDDMLYGGGGADVLDGGAGKDYLQGDHGGDTYIFGKGYDIDTINASSDLNTIIIHGYRASSMINTRNAHNDLIINFGSADSTDCLIVDHFFDYNSNRDFNFIFDDGTVLGQYDITAKYAPIYGTDSDDWLAIQNGDNGIIHGGAGNDGLNGGSGNDELYGEDGDDTLYGNDGDDLMDGGAGNDQLCGGNGTDTYIFAKGYGNDTINEWGSDHSIIKLTDVNSDDVTITDQWGSNMILTINSTGDTLTISNFKWGQGTYSFEFADGAVASVNKDTWELEFSVLPEIPEDDAIQANAEILDELYADDMASSELFTENESTVISEISDVISVDNETDEIADITDIQFMILTENMAAFGDDSNIYDSMNLDGMNSDMMDMSQLLVGNSVQ